MIVSNRQQFGTPPREPLLSGHCLALGAVAVAAGVVGNALMGTVAASLDMTAKGGGTAGLDGAHGLELFERERVVVTVRLAVTPEDIGQLEAGPGHASGLDFTGAAWLALFHQRRLGLEDLIQRRTR